MAPFVGTFGSMETQHHSPFLGSPTVFFMTLHPLLDDLHGLVVVPFNLEVCHPAVALGRGNVVMTQKVLDRSKVGIGV